MKNQVRNANIYLKFTCTNSTLEIIVESNPIVYIVVTCSCRVTNYMYMYMYIYIIIQ